MKQTTRIVEDLRGNREEPIDSIIDATTLKAEGPCCILPMGDETLFYGVSTLSDFERHLWRKEDEK